MLASTSTSSVTPTSSQTKSSVISPEASGKASSSRPQLPSPVPKVSKKQTVDQLRDGLAQLGLDTKGKKDTLWRRLVHAIHRASLRDPPSDDSDDDLDIQEEVAGGKSSGHSKNRKRQTRQQYRSFLCFDVEATCRGGKEFDWPNEIIEFPVVLLRWTEPDKSGKRKLEQIDTFRSYVRPIWQPQLSDFCKTLTGISQETVDAAPTFPQMLIRLENWLDKWELREKDGSGLKEALWVTDGPWDLRDFIPKQLHITPINPTPTYLHGPYINIKYAVQAVLSETWRRKAYALDHPNDPPNARALAPITTAKFGRLDKANGKIREAGPSYYFNIPGMLEAMDLGVFQGRQHSGLDDATNVARILIALSEKDVVIEANARTQPPGSGRKYPWMNNKGEVKWEEWMSSNKDVSATAKSITPGVPKENCAIDETSRKEVVGVDSGAEGKRGTKTESSGSE